MPNRFAIPSPYAALAFRKKPRCELKLKSGNTRVAVREDIWPPGS
jgi:hypothetical protein